MIATGFIFQLKNFIVFLIAGMLILSIASCTKKTTFLTSSVVPAAQGTVQVKSDGNKNYRIEIEVFNLAEPDRLQPPKKMYMVWMVTDQDITKNIGQIKTSSKTFSKNLKASFETVSSFKPMKIFITAEDDTNIQNPNYEIVLSTNRF